MPAQASWPAPTRRPLARPSLTIHTINAAVHNERRMVDFVFSISIRLIFCLIFVPRIALRVILQPSVYCPSYNMPVPRDLLNILQTLLLLLLVLRLTHNRGIAAITTAVGHRLLFLLLPLSYFCPCHAVAYLAAPVDAINKHAETNVKYPAFTDPPDHPEILQIIQIFLQIVQTASRFICTYHSDHTDSTQVDHTDPADHTAIIIADPTYPTDHTYPTR